MKQRTVILLFAAGIVSLITGIILIVRPTTGERHFSRAYKELRIGRTAEEVERSFRSPPSFQCRYRNSLIQYYAPPPPRTRWMDTRGKVDGSKYTEGDVFTEIHELPDPYDHVVVAYDPDRAAIAYTRIGEEIHVHTKARGRVRGASLLNLEPTDFGVPE